MPGVQGGIEPPPGVVPNFENPTDVGRTLNLVCQGLGIFLVAPFVALRVYTKAYISPPFVLEDWICVSAWFFYTIYNISAICIYGGGYHAWDLSKEELKQFFQVVYAGSMIYNLNAYSVKVTLLLMTARVFDTHRMTQFTAYALIGIMGCYYLPIVIVKSQTCHPIVGYWDKDIPAKCLDQAKMYCADTIISAISDTSVLLLPIPATWSLRLTWRKKVKVALMLGAGGIATIASIARMVLVLRLPNSDDPTVDIIKFNLLGTAEGCIGLICACLPAANLLWMRSRARRAADQSASGGRCPRCRGRGRGRSSTQRSGTMSSISKMKIKFLGSRLRTQSLPMYTEHATTTQPPAAAVTRPATQTISRGINTDETMAADHDWLRRRMIWEWTLGRRISFPPVGPCEDDSLWERQLTATSMQTMRTGVMMQSDAMSLPGEPPSSTKHAPALSPPPIWRKASIASSMGEAGPSETGIGIGL